MPDKPTHATSADEVATARRRSPVPRGLLLKRAVWSVVQATVFRHSFHKADRFRAGLLRAFGAEVGHDCTIRRTSRVYYPWNLTLGDLSALGDRTEVYNLGKIQIGRRVTISQEAYLCAGTHDYSKRSMPLLTPPIVVDDDAWVCVRALIGPGVSIGAGAIVGAGAVVFKNVPAWTIVAGSPARVIKGRVPLSE